MPGDPGAVHAGAAQLSALAEQFTSAGEGIRAAGSSWAAGWTGAAAHGASAQVEEVGSRAAIGADVSRAVGTALTTYATELRSAQEMYARGEQMVAGGQAAQASAGTTLDTLTKTAAPQPASMHQDVAIDQAQAAVDRAGLQVGQGQQLMAQAVAREQAANAAAASSVQGAHGRLADMVAPVPGVAGAVAGGPAGPPAAPAAPPEEEGGFSWGDLGHTALDVGGLVPVVGAAFDGANAAWYAAEGDYLDAGVSAAAAIPFVGDAAIAGKYAYKAVRGGVELANGLDRVAPAAARAGEALPGLSDDAATAVRSAETPAAGRTVAEQAPVPEKPPTADTPVASDEPVDLASGLLFAPEVDVELPGLLPLVLERMHVSNYRAGRFFGPSWASTLDQHLEVSDDAVRFARADGHVLTFPRPGPVPVASTFSERWTLADDGGTLLVEDLDGLRTLRFTGTGRDRWLTGITDRPGHRIEVRRAPDGTPTEVRHDGGYRVLVTTALGRIVGYDLVEGGPDGATRALRGFGYTAGNLTAVVDSSNLPFRYGYDERGRITGWVDRIGTWFRNEYDDQDRVVRQTGVEGVFSARFSYAGDVVEMTDALGHTSRYVHDGAERIVRAVDPEGGETRYEWRHGGRIASFTDELGRRTGFGYDDAGMLTSVVRPDGSTTTVDRDVLGLPVLVVDPDGAVWQHEYDDRGLRTATTDPTGARTEYRHDDRGHLAAVVDALGGETLLETDAAGLPVAVTDPLGATTRWERDASGRVVAEVDALGGRTTSTWTPGGLPASTTTPDGRVTRAVHDGERNVVAVTDAAGHTTRFERDHFELPAARIDPDGARHEYVWDEQRRLVEVRDPQGLSWTYERDRCGRVIAETDFDGRRRTYERDRAGQVIARRNALGQAVAFTHDLLGNITGRRAGGALTTFDHDAAGRLVRATTPDVDVVLDRDRLGRVVSEAVNGRAVTSSFDGLGRRERRVTPTGQVSVWTHDAASRVTALHAGVAIGFDHDAVGRETRRRAGAAVVAQEWGVEGLRSQSAGPVSRHYSYRADGYLAAIEGSDGAAAVDLDVRGRVTGVRAEGWTERYGYDVAGNLTAASWPGADPESVGGRAYRGTVLVRAGHVSYAHDAEGRVVRRTRRRLSHKPESWHYEWDALDRLVGVTTPDGVRWRYVHDALGRRVSKRRLDASGAVAEQVDFAWDGPTLVEQVAHGPDGTSATTWDHDESGLRPVSQRERVRRAGQEEIDERFYAVVTDLVGAPTELLDLDGAVVARARRSLWGKTTWTGSASTPLLFPGQYLDAETGFADNLHRQYDPDTARYASLDPLGLAPAPNPSTYVHNPHTWLDPLGLSGCPRPVSPSEIRYSQNSVNDAAEVIDSMKRHGWQGRPIDVVRMPDGQLTAVDNTRVLAARHTGIDVQARVHDHADAIDPSRATSLADRSNVKPTTWGQGVQNRISTQNSTWRQLYPSGSHIIGWRGN